MNESQPAISPIAKLAQKFHSAGPAIILGSGASASFGMSGMWQLAQHLIERIDSEGLPEADQREWANFKALLEDNVDLETALHRVQLCPDLTNAIVRATWELLSKEDIEVFHASLSRRDFFPLGALLRAMFHSTRKSIDIITTNYDRLAEYACEQEQIHHYSGFSHGYKRSLASEDHLRCERQVNIWKVHGSLDWFVTRGAPVFGLPNVSAIPPRHKPVIVTPGIQKYQITYEEPFRTAIARADRALVEASSYLCIGFGFNDLHIQEKLIEGCVQRKKPVTIITYALSDSARQFLYERGVDNYLAIERGLHDGESVIHSSLASDPVRIEQDYWSLPGYLGLIL